MLSHPKSTTGRFGIKKNYNNSTKSFDPREMHILSLDRIIADETFNDPAIIV